MVVRDFKPHPSTEREEQWRQTMKLVGDNFAHGQLINSEIPMDYAKNDIVFKTIPCWAVCQQFSSDWQTPFNQGSNSWNFPTLQGVKFHLKFSLGEIGLLNPAWWAIENNTYISAGLAKMNLFPWKYFLLSSLHWQWLSCDDEALYPFWVKLKILLMELQHMKLLLPLLSGMTSSWSASV